MDYKDYEMGLKKDYFWFKGKTNLINQLLKKLNLKNNIKILDIGAGTGDDLSTISKFGKTHVIDINQKALDLINNNLITEKKLSDACNISYPDNTFDICLAFDVLEHIPNDKLAIKEINRVLKSGGLFIFTVPAFQSLYSKHDKHINHYRRYNKKSLKNLFLKTNGNFLSLNYWFFSLLFPVIIQRLLINNFVFSDNKINNLPKIINNIFFNILKAENHLISKGFSFPFGLSLYGIYKKS